jgi:hypothetical protein
MQVGTANGARGHLDDGIPAMLDLRIGHGFAPDIAFAMPGKGFHREDSTAENNSSSAAHAAWFQIK